MRKHFFLIPFFGFAIVAFSQQKLPNNLIGKNESEITLFYFLDNNSSMVNGGRDALGGQFIYRWAWKRYTKGRGGIFIFCRLCQGERAKIGCISLRCDIRGYHSIYWEPTKMECDRRSWPGNL